MSEPISEPGNHPNQPGKAVKLEKQPHGGALRRGGGRKPGHGNRATRFRVDAATDEEAIKAAVDLLHRAIAGGDLDAALGYLKLVLPRPRPAPAPVPGGLDVQNASGLLDAFRKLVLALGDGTLAPSEVSQASAALKGLAEAMSLSDFESRLAALEDAAREKGGQNG